MSELPNPYCGECLGPIERSGDHPACNEAYQRRMAEAMEKYDSDPETIVNAAAGAILLERLAEGRD